MSYEDYNHHYRGCVGLLIHPEYTEDDKPCLFSFETVDSEIHPGDSLTGGIARDKEIKDNKWTNVRFRYGDDRIKLEFPFPRVGLMNFNKGVFNIVRTPAHQWKKGIHRNVLQFVNLTAPEQEILERDILNNEQFFRPRVIQELFHPRFFTPTEAFESVVSGQRLAAALDRNFFVKMSFISNDILIGYKEYVIGILYKRAQSPIIAKLFPRNEFLLEQLSSHYTVE